MKPMFFCGDCGEQMFTNKVIKPFGEERDAEHYMLIPCKNCKDKTYLLGQKAGLYVSAEVMRLIDNMRSKD